MNSARLLGHLGLFATRLDAHLLLFTNTKGVNVNTGHNYNCTQKPFPLLRQWNMDHTVEVRRTVSVQNTAEDT